MTFLFNIYKKKIPSFKKSDFPKKFAFVVVVIVDHSILGQYGTNHVINLITKLFGGNYEFVFRSIWGKH